MRGFKASFLALMLAAPAVALAAPADVTGAVARADRTADAVKLDESRKPAQVLSFLGLQKGDRVLDVMTGSGYYADIMARAVGPAGAVIAWEPENFYGEKAKAGWAELTGRVPNARLMVSPATSFALAPDSLDFVLMHMVYHDWYWQSDEYKFPRLDPAAMLAKVYAATKPGGIVGVVDHVASAGGDTREVVDKLHRIDPATVRADFERAGFVLEAQSELLANPADDHSKLVFDPSIRGKTDRFVYRFRKPR